MTITGPQLVSEAEKLGGAAIGYSETLNGGVGPQYYDCSGLVETSLKDLGISAPRTSEEQWAWVQSNHTSFTNAAQLVPGDLVFANFPGEVSPGHVGIYEGNGQVYSARSTASGIGSDPLSSWSGHIVGYATVPNVAGGGAAPASGSTTGFFSDLNPANWGAAVGQDLVSAPVKKAWNWILDALGVQSLTDMLERGALIIFGSILLIMGLISIARNGNNSPVSNVQSSKKEGAQIAAKESDAAEADAATKASKAGYTATAVDKSAL